MGYQLQPNLIVCLLILLSLVLCFHLLEAAFHQYHQYHPYLLGSRGNIWNPGDDPSFTDHHTFIEKSSHSRRRLSLQLPNSKPSMLFMVTSKDEIVNNAKERKNDWFSRFSKKEPKDDSKEKKNKSRKEKNEDKRKRVKKKEDVKQRMSDDDNNNGNWLSRVSRKVFSKPQENELKKGPILSKKRDLFLKSKLGQVSTLSNRDLTEPSIQEEIPENKPKLWQSLEMEIQEKSELRKKELLEKSLQQKQESKLKYQKQMELLQRNKAIADAASNKKDTNLFPFLSQNNTAITTKPKDKDVQVNETKSWGVANFASNLWNNTFKSSNAKKEVEEWITVCPKTRISPNQIVPVVAAGLDLLLVASKDGNSVYCIANSCPHLGTPLDLGTLERRPRKPLSSSEKISASNLKKKSRLISNNTYIDNMFSNNDDGCEDCIVCPLHQTAFALQNGEVRGEWCPYPPVVGKLMGTVKSQSNLPTFEIRVRGKNIEVRISSDLGIEENGDKKNFLDIF